jgi:hypothetical protein
MPGVHTVKVEVNDVPLGFGTYRVAVVSHAPVPALALPTSPRAAAATTTSDVTTPRDAPTPRTVASAAGDKAKDELAKATKGNLPIHNLAMRGDDAGVKALLDAVRCRLLPACVRALVLIVRLAGK